MFLTILSFGKCVWSETQGLWSQSGLQGILALSLTSCLLFDKLVYWGLGFLVCKIEKNNVRWNLMTLPFVEVKNGQISEFHMVQPTDYPIGWLGGPNKIIFV